ncbi:MAG TPA: hypothetical protein VFQ11_01605 [Nocardioidaceae bacterium]|nr:hypothetical protein [Nocardioidaceae bacterium]
MTEPRAQPADVSGPEPDTTRTRLPLVDEVLDSLDQLSDLPVTRHVAVLEAAHDRLRDALSSGGT